MNLTRTLYCNIQSGQRYKNHPEDEWLTCVNPDPLAAHGVYIEAAPPFTIVTIHGIPEQEEPNHPQAFDYRVDGPTLPEFLELTFYPTPMMWLQGGTPQKHPVVAQYRRYKDNPEYHFVKVLP